MVRNNNIQDNLRFEDETEITVFNHYSFCELIKHIMIKYAHLSYDDAHYKVMNSFLAEVSKSVNDVELLSHELEFHWAMLLAHGNMYWTKGIPSDYNEFRAEYLAWESDVKLRYGLKDSFEYFDLKDEDKLIP